MNNFLLDKKMLKQKNREATIKHYLLGYMLECMVKEDIDVIFNIRKFLVYNLKILDEKTFIHCVYRIRIQKFFFDGNTKRNYKKIKESINLIPYSKNEQLKIIKKLQEFASNYEDGIYITPKMGESSFILK